MSEVVESGQNNGLFDEVFVQAFLASNALLAEHTHELLDHIQGRAKDQNKSITEVLDILDPKSRVDSLLPDDLNNAIHIKNELIGAIKDLIGDGSTKPQKKVMSRLENLRINENLILSHQKEEVGLDLFMANQKALPRNQTLNRENLPLEGGRQELSPDLEKNRAELDNLITKMEGEGYDDQYLELYVKQAINFYNNSNCEQMDNRIAMIKGRLEVLKAKKAASQRTASPLEKMTAQKMNLQKMTLMLSEIKSDCGLCFNLCKLKEFVNFMLNSPDTAKAVSSQGELLKNAGVVILNKYHNVLDTAKSQNIYIPPKVIQCFDGLEEMFRSGEIVQKSNDRNYLESLFDLIDDAETEISKFTENNDIDEFAEPLENNNVDHVDGPVKYELVGMINNIPFENDVGSHYVSVRVDSDGRVYQYDDGDVSEYKDIQDYYKRKILSSTEPYPTIGSKKYKPQSQPRLLEYRRVENQ